jgi:tRNA (guanine-N1)-methyltransferase
LRFDILTIFPQFLDSPLEEGIIRRAVAAGKISVNIHNLRDFALDKHTMTDDRPYGGGEGMVMKPEPIAGTLRYIVNISSCFVADMKELMRESGQIMWTKRFPSGILFSPVEN